MRHVNQTRDEYLIIDWTDAYHREVCKSVEETCEVLGNYASITGLFVRRITVNELAREWTAQAFLSEFGDEPEPDEWAGTSYDRAASAADAINDIRRDLRDILEGS